MLLFLHSMQYCGSRSFWEPGSGSASDKNQDPDPHQSSKSDPDPHQGDADPQHFFCIRTHDEATISSEYQKCDLSWENPPPPPGGFCGGTKNKYMGGGFVFLI